MGPLELLKAAARILKSNKTRFAVAGGLVENFFRQEPRLTKDVDLLLLLAPPGNEERMAKSIIRQLGFEPASARAAALSRAPMMGKRTTPVVVVIGRKKADPKGVGIDFLLPAMPWVPEAVERAQLHLVDYGFGKLPTITAEDFVLAEAFALQNNPSRYKDLDDLQSLFEASLPLDEIYLVSRFEKYGLNLPREIESLAPRALRRASRVQRKAKR